MLRRLRRRGDPKPVLITYDKGFPGLPDDIICEIFTLLDTEALKSCSLTCRALSFSAKPFVHRTLRLAPRSDVPGGWNGFEGLPILAERGLLQHTRHLSILLRFFPLFADQLQPNIQHLRTLTNLKSLKARWLDIPSFIPKVEECFGAFLVATIPGTRASKWRPWTDSLFRLSVSEPSGSEDCQQRVPCSVHE